MITFNKVSFLRRLVKFGVITVLVFSAVVSGALAQSKQKKLKKDVLPRVGAIKDTEDVGRYITGGCDYHYVKIRGEKNPEAFVFVSTANPLLAMMNLNGSDIRLELVKSTLWYEYGGDAFARHTYRAGKVLITVSFWQYSDYISDFPVKIVLRKGRAVRTIRAYGTPQCDAI